MKLKFTLLAATCIFFSLLVMPVASMAGDETRPGSDKEATKEEAKKTTRSHSSRNNNAVKIYPDVFKRVMHVVAKGNDNKEIDFFVFDLEGTLIKHYRMENGDHKKMTGLNRGKYVYHVFAGDEETAFGEFEIR
jgi:hypothetical protein